MLHLSFFPHIKVPRKLTNFISVNYPLSISQKSINFQSHKHIMTNCRQLHYKHSRLTNITVLLISNVFGSCWLSSRLSPQLVGIVFGQYHVRIWCVSKIRLKYVWNITRFWHYNFIYKPRTREIRKGNGSTTWLF